MTDKKSNECRRKLLKSIAAGSGAIVAGKSLPESWSRPVVDSVMLPVHAQTSQRTFFSSELLSGVQHDQLLGTTPEELFARSEEGPLSWFIEPAEAQPPGLVICLNVTGSSYQVEIQYGGDGYYSGSGTVNDVLEGVTGICNQRNPRSFTVHSIIGNMANVTLFNTTKGKEGVVYTGPVPEQQCNFDFGCTVPV